ncbi:cation transport protein-domain-containing protein [Colletotrichum navitas]|uniref:Cation transport protein-domain-containing protein n=1 Tax=Colletotrichum navitas TaxID=681940 RepID=A0AAD8PTG1_9PEZI|nr:cation transport protein-domain-containing protein [Colletotrichum navitas]KAK1579707.1 cation transport protein-domain-containing protein [Colletotrichum navitas]
MTEAGLNTVNLSEVTVWQQVMLWLLIIVGSSVWVSVWTVLARKHVFEKSLREIVQASDEERDRQHGQLPFFNGRDAASRGKGGASVTGVMERGALSQARAGNNHITIDTPENLTRPPPKKAATPSSTLSQPPSAPVSAATSTAPFVLGSLALGAWIANNMPTVATSNGANPWWAGIFFAVSAFNNSGMSLLDANMVPFQQAYFVLIAMGLLILAGNTTYPLFLRLIFWSALKVLRLTTREETHVELKSTLEFILRYPRRVYTNLFPSRPTWWLFFMVVLTNGIDWMAFEVLNIGNPVIEAIPIEARVLDGLFQAIAVRSGGFYVIPIASAYPGLQVLYVIMMYISVYPVVITMRHSNVYEERSLGIYADNDDTPSRSSADEKKHAGGNGLLTKLIRDNLSFAGVGAANPKKVDGLESRTSFVGQQIRGQLAHDLWLLSLAVLIIVTIETSHFLEDPVHFSVFNVVFEVVSGYGCVGISVGLPKDAMSFSTDWHAGSKLVLCLVMLRGRHRGLPVALDRAVRLPGQRLLEDEEEDWRLRRARSGRGLENKAV